MNQEVQSKQRFFTMHIKVVSLSLVLGLFHAPRLVDAFTADVWSARPQDVTSKKRGDLRPCAVAFQPLLKPTFLRTPRKMKDEDSDGAGNTVFAEVLSNPSRALAFSGLMTLSGALLGPFLDSYHSMFGVLRYEQPITLALWGTSEHPALITAWWVPALFGLAGFIIGWLYILLDALNETTPDIERPSTPKILVGISIFTFQYWLSGVLSQSGAGRTTILNIMSIAAAIGFISLDGSFAGFVTSAATAVGGPLIEVGLLSLSRAGAFAGTGYQYLDLGETGFFPLWIVPVYFLGGPAVGNLARGFWNGLGSAFDESEPQTKETPKDPAGCTVCGDTRRVPCPNCDGIGEYVAMGGKSVECSSCRGRGFVICRSCFDHYGEDPNDIEAIRELMSSMPD